MANFCVTPAGSGTQSGADWNNALGAGFAPVRGTGNTYYLAGGAYGNKTWNTAASGTTVITIKKATVADHGVATGWSDSLASAAVTFTGWTVSTSYWVLDGQTGGGPGQWTSGFGFTLFSSSAVIVTFSGVLTDITMRHFSLDSDRGATFIAGIKGTTDSGGAVGGTRTNIQIDHFAITDIFGPSFHVNAWSNTIIEYGYVARNKSTAAFHSEMISSIGTNTNWTWRYCIFDQTEGTAVFAGVNTGSSIDWKIYGCLISRSVNTGPLNYTCEGGGSSNNQTMQGLRCFNNTIAGGTATSQGGIFIAGGCGSTNNEVRNNLFYDNDGNSFAIDATNSHQFASDNIRSEGGPFDKDAEILSGSGGTNGQNSSGSPFVSYNAGNPVTGDWRLASNTNAGVNLGAPYNTDMNGTIRTTWSRGAFEFGSGGGGGDVIAPAAPTNLRIQ